MNFCRLCLIFIFSLFTLSASAAGLILHTAEMGVGKFHRMDNQVHNYGSSAWAPYVMLDSDKGLTTFSRKNTDGSYTIFYSSLESMMKEAVKIAKTENTAITVLNVHGHGLPGAMWFPATDAILNSSECNSWRKAAEGSDKDNYDQYYSPVGKSDIMQIRQMSGMSDLTAFMGCVTGLSQWKTVVKENPEFKSSLSKDAILHFASCVVGLGKAGEIFTQGIAELLLPIDGQGRVETSVNFGLGDWSIPKGMGFWDYQNDAQLKHDNSIYGTHRNDSEIAQMGSIRMSQSQQGKWTTTLVGNQSEMSLEHGGLPQGPLMAETSSVMSLEKMPTKIRIPRTNSFIELKEK